MKKVTFLSLIIFSIIYSQNGWGPEIVAVYMDSLGYPGIPFAHYVAVNGDTIHIVGYWTIKHPLINTWVDEILYTRSVDAGNTWESPRIISKLDSLDSVLPSICVNGNSVHVAWQEGNTYSFQYRRSLDAGETWQPIQTLIPQGRSQGGWIANSGDTLIITVTAPTNPDSNKLWFTKSLNNGSSWSPPVLLPYYKYVSMGKSALSSGVVHVVGSIGVDSGANWHGEVYYIRSNDLGNTWDTLLIISERDNYQDLFSFSGLYKMGSNVYVTWFGWKYSPYPWTGDIFLRISRDNGITWEAIRETVSVSHLATQSSVCGVDHQIHIVWVEELSSYNWELYYRWASGYGFKWSQIERLTFAERWSYYPSLAYSNGKLHLVWVDERPGAVGIYYRQKQLTSVQEKTQIDYNIINFYSNFIEDNLIFKVSNKLSDIEIFDISGRKLKVNFYKVKEQKYILNFKNYPSGIYFIFLDKKNKIKILKRR